MVDKKNDKEQMIEKETKKIKKPESISDISISCSRRCSNMLRILTFLMINGKGSSILCNHFILR